MPQFQENRPRPSKLVVMFVSDGTDDKPRTIVDRLKALSEWGGHVATTKVWIRAASTAHVVLVVVVPVWTASRPWVGVSMWLGFSWGGAGLG